MATVEAMVREKGWIMTESEIMEQAKVVERGKEREKERAARVAFHCHVMWVNFLVE